MACIVYFERLGRALLIVLTSLLLFAPSVSKASHSSGLDLTYKCLGGNKYELQLSFYRFCDGISAPNSVSIDIESDSCGHDFSRTLSMDSISGVDVTPYCSSTTTDCVDPNSSFPGIEWYRYTGVVDLPSQCHDWTFQYSLCCRNPQITTINNPGSEDIHVSTQLDNLNYPCNSSPRFTNHPIAYFCKDQLTCFNHGVVEPDGDSLSYRFVTPSTGPSSTVSYNAGYSANQPLQTNPPMTINDSTGTICVNATQTDVTVMEVEVTEWRNGDSIGVVRRDLQFRILDCPGSNSVPYINGINDSVGHFNKTVCEGDSVNFDIPSHDSDATQNLTLDWNQGIPSGSFDTSSGNQPVGTFSWQTDSSHGGANHCFTVKVSDDNCPLNGTQTYSFCVDVLDVDSTLKNTQISYGSGTFCYDAPDQTPVINGQKGGRFWSDPAGLDLDTATGTIDVQNSAADSSYTVYYQTPDSLKCSVVDSVPITIDSNKVADFHYPDTSYCETGGKVSPVFLNGGTHGIFSSDTSALKVDSIYGVVDIQASEEGTYWVYNNIPASGSCPGDIDSAKIIVEDLPGTGVSPDNDSICEGDTYTMNGTYSGGASQITWTSFGDGNFNDVNDTNAVYTPGNQDINNGDVDILIESDSVKVCPADEDTMNLTILSPASIEAGADDTICPSASQSVNASFSGTANGVTWSTSGDGFFDDANASSTVYHPGQGDLATDSVVLKATTVGTKSCPAFSDSLTLTILNQPDPGFSYPGYSYCKSDDSTIVPDIEGDTGGVFTADPPGGLDLDSTTGAIDLSGSYADIYDITYTVGDKCPADTTVQMRVYPQPSTPAPTPFKVCPGGTDELSVNAVVDSAAWYKRSDASDAVEDDTTYTPDPGGHEEPGVYTYYVRTYENGCPSELGSVDVTVHDHADVVVNTEPSPAEGVKPFDVTFSNGSGANVVDYTLEFGKGMSVDRYSWTDTTVTYEEKGEYTVRATGYDTLTGCSGSTELLVKVTSEPQASLPNVFTPNGDGRNDVFAPKLNVPCPDKDDGQGTCWNGIASFQGTIFNRWGNKVYEWSDWDDAWRGENASSGTYYYVIDVTGENGSKKTYKGQITLMRDAK